MRARFIRSGLSLVVAVMLVCSPSHAQPQTAAATGTDNSMGEFFRKACFTDAPSTNALDVLADILSQLGGLKIDLTRLVRVTTGDFTPDFSACGLPLSLPGLPNLNGILGCFSGAPGLPNLQQLFLDTVGCVGNEVSQIPQGLIPNLDINSIFRCVDGIIPEIPSVSLGTGLSNLLSVLNGIVSAAESIQGDLGKWQALARLLGNVCGTRFGTSGSTGPAELPSGVAFGSNSSVSGSTLKVNLKANQNTLAGVIPSVAGASMPPVAAAEEAIVVSQVTAIIRPLRGARGTKSVVLRAKSSDEFARNISLVGLKRGTYVLSYIVQFDTGAITEFSGGTFTNSAAR